MWSCESDFEYRPDMEYEPTKELPSFTTLSAKSRVHWSWVTSSLSAAATAVLSPAAALSSSENKASSTMPSSSQFLPSVLASCAVSRRKTCPNCRVWNSASPKSYGASWPKLLISGTSHVKLTPTSCRHPTSQKAAGHVLTSRLLRLSCFWALASCLTFTQARQGCLQWIPINSHESSWIRLCKVIKIYLNNNKAEPLQPKQHINTSHGRSWDEFQGLCSCLVHTKSLSQHPEAFHPWVLNFLLLSIKLLAFSSHLER